MHFQRFIVPVALFVAAATSSGAANAPGVASRASAGSPRRAQPAALRHHLRAHRNACSGLGQFAFVGGAGTLSDPNYAAGYASGVLSGYGNLACGRGSGLGAGGYNEVDSYESFIGGGDTNVAGGSGGVNGIVAGYSNNNQSFAGLIGAGWNNAMTSYCPSSYCSGGQYAAIVAGNSNTVDGSATNTANDSIIGAGAANALTGQYAAIVSGYQNHENGDYGFVGGGAKNVLPAQADHGFIGGGSGNSVVYSYGAVAGGSGWDPLESTCRHASLSIL